jgi:type IV pilus assembly protein PilN
MPRINLLPWRAELREKRKKEFLTAILAAVLCGGLLAYGYKLTVQAQIRAQNQRNTVLREEIAQLDMQIEEINTLEAQKERLLARMEIIDQLQKSRPGVVHLFDELVSTLPEGTYLTEVKQSSARIEITGSAQSSTRVAALMRNIDASEWLRDPGLDVVQTVDEGAARNAQFKIFAQQIVEQSEEAEAAAQLAPTEAAR